MVGSFRVAPAGAAKTICAVAPEAAGKRCSSRSIACCDWVPGTVNCVDSGFETMTEMEATAIRIISQASRVAQRCRKVPRPIFASSPAISSSASG